MSTYMNYTCTWYKVKLTKNYKSASDGIEDGSQLLLMQIVVQVILVDFPGHHAAGSAGPNSRDLRTCARDIVITGDPCRYYLTSHEQYRGPFIICTPQPCVHIVNI